MSGNSKKKYELFLDESGDHLLFAPDEYDKDPEKETHCTLVGVILDHQQKTDLKDRLVGLKRHFWNTDRVILHSVEIRHKKGPFAIFQYSPDLYEEFKVKIDEIIKEVNPIIICSSIDKKLWVEQYPRKLFFNDDPYEQAFVFLIERYAHFLNSKKEVGLDIVGRVVCERRDTYKDRNLKKVYTSVCNYGTQYTSDSDNYECLPEKMDFFNKKFNIPGLQLSDYACYPFYTDHKYPRRENKLYDFLEQFIYPGEYLRYGHKKWPV
ncbi:DUF3800 domain-containing protein [candidate division KSB1 bacterium]